MMVQCPAVIRMLDGDYLNIWDISCLFGEFRKREDLVSGDVVDCCVVCIVERVVSEYLYFVIARLYGAPRASTPWNNSHRFHLYPWVRGAKFIAGVELSTIIPSIEPSHKIESSRVTTPPLRPLLNCISRFNRKFRIILRNHNPADRLSNLVAEIIFRVRTTHQAIE